MQEKCAAAVVAISNGASAPPVPPPAVVEAAAANGGEQHAQNGSDEKAVEGDASGSARVAHMLVHALVVPPCAWFAGALVCGSPHGCARLRCDAG